MSFKGAITIISLGLMGILSSCAEVEESRIPQMVQFQDSIFAHYPTVRAVTVNVVDNKTLIFALGDPTLYKKPEAYRDKMGKELGALTIRIMGKDHGLRSAKMIVTTNIHNMGAEPKDGLTTEIDLANAPK